MADSSSRPSSDESRPKRLQLPTTHSGLLFRGSMVSVYFHRQPLFTSREQSYSQAKALISFELAVGTLRRFIGGSWRNERIAGRSLFFLPRGVPHEVRWECETELVELYYEPAFFRALPPESVAAVLARDTLPDAADDPVIWDLALAICSWCADGVPVATVITDIGALIGKRLVLHHGELRKEKKGPKLTADQRGRLDDYIQANLAKKVRVPQLARVVSVSVSHFGVLCRNSTGRAPVDYLRECRLWKAHAMARTGNFRRREIARACGFYDGSHLNREFKKFFKHSLGPLAE